MILHTLLCFQRQHYEAIPDLICRQLCSLRDHLNTEPLGMYQTFRTGHQVYTLAARLSVILRTQRSLLSPFRALWLFMRVPSQEVLSLQAHANHRVVEHQSSPCSSQCQAFLPLIRPCFDLGPGRDGLALLAPGSLSTAGSS